MTAVLDVNKAQSTIRIKHCPSLPDEAREIRIEVFVKEQGFIEEFDAIDSASIHFVAFDGETAVGTCRVFKTEGAASYTLGRLAVRKSHRGQGIGKELLVAAENYAREMKSPTLILHAQCAAQRFYEKCGFAAYGSIDYEQDCPHSWMKKALKAHTP